MQVGESISRGKFSESEAGKSSTRRELLRTFENGLSSSAELIQSRILKHRTDNQNVARLLSVGSRKPEVQELVTDIFRLCIQNNIQLVPNGYPGRRTSLLMRRPKVPMGMITCSVQNFCCFGHILGPHTINGFSSFKTRQIPRFCR